jgi:membrane associated rhomboid family serine protease
VNARRPPQRRRFGFSNLGITRGALIVAGIEVGFSLVWMLSNVSARASIAQYLVASPSTVFEHGRVWSLATSPFLEIQFLNLLLHVFVLWMFVSTLERFWGTARFYRFFAITSLVGSAGGVLAGQLLGTDVPIHGLSPFIYAAIVAFGIVYARQPVQFFGVLPLTGRQLMYGFIGFLVLFVGLQQAWAVGASYAAAMLAAAVMTSKRWSPGLALKRWRLRRARAKLTVMSGGDGRGSTGKRDEQTWLN